MTFGMTNPLACDSQWKAVAAGAATSWVGLDYTFVGMGAPPAVHWALAGTAIDAYCKGWKLSDAQTMAMCALGGYAGGFGVQLARGMGVPFMGPLLQM